MYGCLDEVAGGVSSSSNSAAFLRMKARNVFMVGSLPVFAKCAVQSDIMSLWSPRSKAATITEPASIPPYAPIPFMMSCAVVAKTYRPFLVFGVDSSYAA